MAETGVGETVRPGDKLVRISPASADKAIEMVADGIDAPLLNVGRKVKILYGIPAIPLPAWPELMAGTYGASSKSSTRLTMAKAISASGWSLIRKKTLAPSRACPPRHQGHGMGHPQPCPAMV